MKLLQEMCQIYAAVLMLGIVLGEETTTLFPEPESDMDLGPTSDLTVFTYNTTRMDSDAERNETEIKYRPTLISPTEVGTVVANSTATSNSSSTATRRPNNERINDDETTKEKKELEEEESEDYVEIEVEEKSEEVDEEEEEKFISKPNEITLEHIDFVQLRLKHITLSTSNNITEIKLLQKKEFELNDEYKRAWEEALRMYNDSKRWEIYEDVSNTSTAVQVPEEYHIALIAYTLNIPTPMYADFNKKTREVCSGKDVGDYHYKSYFKLLLLAIQALGKETKFKSSNRFLYRGVSSRFNLEIGQVLSFQHFVSTSTSLKVAEGFAQNTLFEMEGPFIGTSLSIRHHSYFKTEEEVLFSPLQVYKVDSKHTGNYYTRYVLVAYEFKMDGEECGFEPVFNATATVNDKPTIGTNNKTTVAERNKTTNLFGNQLKIVRSSGESLTYDSFVHCWSGIVFLGFVHKWSIWW